MMAGRPHSRGSPHQSRSPTLRSVNSKSSQFGVHDLLQELRMDAGSTTSSDMSSSKIATNSVAKPYATRLDLRTQVRSAVSDLFNGTVSRPSSRPASAATTRSSSRPSSAQSRFLSLSLSRPSSSRRPASAQSMRGPASRVTRARPASATLIRERPRSAMAAGDHESSNQRLRFAAGPSGNGRERGALMRPGSAPPRAGTMTGHKRSGDGSDAGVDLEELSDVFEDEGEEEEEEAVVVSEESSMSGKYDKMIDEDMLIADLYEDVQEANRQLSMMESRHGSAMDAVQSKSREIEDWIRELEKQNSFFRSAILSGDNSDPSNQAGGLQSHNSSAVVNTEGGEVCKRTAFLHDAIGTARPGGDNFRRVTPQYRSKNLHGGNAWNNATVRLLQAPTAHKGSVGSLQTTAGKKKPSAQPKRGEEPSSAAAADEDGVAPGPGGVAGGGTDKAREVWLETFKALHSLSVGDKEGKAGGGLQVLANLRAEFSKRRSIVSKEVMRIVGGASSERMFHDSVNALDQKTRTEMLDEVADHMSHLGIFLRLQTSMVMMSKCGLDSTLCRHVFTNEVKETIKASHVRLFMVDDENAQIWEWNPSNPEEMQPNKRSLYSIEVLPDVKKITSRRTYVKSGIAADVARTGQPINVPFPAVQSGSFSIEIDRLRGENARTIICEPIRYRGRIIAVVQCYNKVGEDEEAPFTKLDELLLRQLSSHAGIILRRCDTFARSVSVGEVTRNLMGLTQHYPFGPGQLFSLSFAVLQGARDLIEASHCVFYVAYPGARGLWTMSPEGFGPRIDAVQGQGIAGWVADNMQSVCLDDPESDARFEPEIDTIFAEEEGAKPSVGVNDFGFKCTSLLVSPILNQDGSLLGVCMMLNKVGGGGFKTRDQRLLELHGEQVALSVKTCTADFRYFHREETTSEVLAASKRAVLADRSLLFLIDKESKCLVLQRSDHLDMSSMNFVVPNNDGLLGYVAKTGTCICVPDAQHDPRFKHAIDKKLSYKTRSLMALPIPDALNPSIQAGVLLITNKVGASAFSNLDRVMAASLATQIGTLILREGEPHLRGGGDDGSDAGVDDVETPPRVGSPVSAIEGFAGGEGRGGEKRVLSLVEGEGGGGGGMQGIGEEDEEGQREGKFVSEQVGDGGVLLAQGEGGEDGSFPGDDDDQLEDADFEEEEEEEEEEDIDAGRKGEVEEGKEEEEEEERGDHWRALQEGIIDDDYLDDEDEVYEDDFGGD